MSKQPVSFYHDEGLVPTWQLASAYAGPDGHLATLPEIVAARLGSPADATSWNSWYTTNSAEYFGRDENDEWCLVVAHGVGPLSTLDGILSAYKYEYRDKNRRNRGGRISRREFLKLLAGEYGLIAKIPYVEYISRYDYPFYETLTLSDLENDPLMQARLGTQWLAYGERCVADSQAWHRERYGMAMETDPEPLFFSTRDRDDYSRKLAERHDPYVIRVEGAANCPYSWVNHDGTPNFRSDEDGAITHLLSISCPMHTHFGHGQEGYFGDVGCHEWWNGSRFVAIPAGSDLRDIKSCPDPGTLIRKHWRKLCRRTTGAVPPTMTCLKRVGDDTFTTYAKDGARMDTGQIQHPVRSLKALGEPVVFRTASTGTVFVKYDIGEVMRIAPPGANAYEFVSDGFEIDGEWYAADLQFYQADVDTSVEFMTSTELGHNHELILKLLETA